MSDSKEYVDAHNLIVTVTDKVGSEGKPDGFTLFDIIEFHARDQGHDLDTAFSIAEKTIASLTVNEDLARENGLHFRYS